MQVAISQASQVRMRSMALQLKIIKKGDTILMKRHFELYDNTKTYYSPVGEVYSPEVVAAKYAIVNSGLPVVIETDKSHVIFGGYGLLSQYRDMYNIDDSLSDEEAIAEIERIANLPAPEPEPTPEERIAAALEFQSILLMPDEEV